MKGVWVDRNVDYRARRKKRPVLHAGRVEYDIELAVLPCWAHLTDAERHAKIRALIAEIEHEGKAARNGKAPLGVATVLAMHPHDQPEETTTTRAPACHTSVPALLRSFKALLRSVREAFVEAAQSVAKGVVSAIFPDGTFPPRRPFVPSLPLQHYLAAFVGS